MGITDMKKILKKSLIPLVVIFLVFAADCALASGLYANMKTAAGANLISNADPFVFIGGIIKGILSMLGVALVVIIVYAGIIWMTAQGDSKKVEKAKDMIKNAVIGLIIVFAAYAITRFAITSISGAGSASSGSAPIPGSTGPTGTICPLGTTPDPAHDTCI